MSAQRRRTGRARQPITRLEASGHTTNSPRLRWRRLTALTAIREFPKVTENGRVPPSELSRKLLIEPGHTVIVLNPPAGYLDSLHPLPDGASAGTNGARGPADVVQVFARDRSQLERDAAAAQNALKPGGILWASYPSSEDQQTDLSRNHGWGVLNSAGLTATTHVVVDKRWDAVRFQPAAEVKGSAIPAADLLPVGRHASLAFRAVRLVARLLFHVLFRFDVKGRENCPDSGCVVIANHLGWMDATSLLILFPAEPRIHFLADPTSMMRNRLLWMLVRAVGGIVPLDRAQHGNMLLFRHIRRCLELGGVVALFPEGDFGPREGALLPFKKGFAHFAVESEVPVLPVGLAGMKELWLGKRLVVRIGAPIPTTGKSVDEVHRLGEEAVAHLVPAYEEPHGRKPLRRWLTGLF
jgi:1-acyl-sn-glycerol-3-phosphate acyltransferase